MNTLKEPALTTTKFILVTTQRSGSTWVIDMLNSHPQIAAYGELFLDKGKGSPTWCGGKDVTFWNTYFEEVQVPFKKTIKPLFIFKYLNHVYSLRSSIKSVGFKLMYPQMERFRRELLAYIFLNKILIIHLIRANHLDVILSQSTAAFRGVYHLRNSEDTENVKLHLNVSQLVEQLQQQEEKILQAKSWYSKLGLPYMEVIYEELVADRHSFNAVLSFLGIKADATKLSSSLKKINPKSHAELIENYDSVRHVLQKTKFCELLR